MVFHWETGSVRCSLLASAFRRGPGGFLVEYVTFNHHYTGSNPVGLMLMCMVRR